MCLFLPSLSIFVLEWWTHCCPVHKDGVEVQEHPSSLFGVSLLIEVSIEVAQLRTEYMQKILTTQLYGMMMGCTKNNKYKNNILSQSQGVVLPLERGRTER